ncbi:probable G-protein coupled receptor No9 [Ptychodera flava]|uniref:probable G-protein coupled receptor No9 n=1 Tax=Ptychodera flava TaxID=63121 RepID=UPI00396A920F
MAYNVSNDTYIEQSSMEGHVGLLFFEIAITCIIVSENTVVITSYLSMRKLREKVSNIFIVNLAFADMLCGLVPLPLMAAAHVAGGWAFGEALCNFNIVFHVGLSATSAYGVMLVTLDKYIFLIHPLRYHQLVTEQRARIVVVSTWVGTFLYSGIATTTRLNEIHDEKAWANVYPPLCYPIQPTYVLSTAIFYIFIPGIIIIRCGFHILRVIRDQLKKIESQVPRGRLQHNEPTTSNDRTDGQDTLAIEEVEITREIEGKFAEEEGPVKMKMDPLFNEDSANNRLDSNQHRAVPTHQEKTSSAETGTSKKSNEEQKSGRSKKINTTRATGHNQPQVSVQGGIRRVSKTELKAVKTVGLVIAAFFTMWAPFFTTLAVAGACVECPLDFERTLSVTVAIGFANSALNPILYAGNKDFRRAYKKVICCFCSVVSSSINPM